MKCERCGCDDEHACPEDDGDGGVVGCSWVRERLCSSCATTEDYELAAREAGRAPALPLLYDAYGGVLVR